VIPEGDDPLPLIEGEPAFLLDEGVAYVRGWTTPSIRFWNSRRRLRQSARKASCHI
jgi:hypothetical protein